eukprot:gnl/TRDRNA2_/TRDRNA2_186983_c0_seq1.p1 gnl/TRDRNA2_/TRDRNA2_186983_c0~~gnl/TRDRNA2_/TRDRNA2_186983_c0_seq1.p1  ORF type:complete len:740 (+),score=183.44 gnl/TRDRNA2_/TRDRNA2_186983_c0_seq1:87-2306(+)
MLWLLLLPAATLAGGTAEPSPSSRPEFKKSSAVIGSKGWMLLQTTSRRAQTKKVIFAAESEESISETSSFMGVNLHQQRHVPSEQFPRSAAAGTDFGQHPDVACHSEECTLASAKLAALKKSEELVRDKLAECATQRMKLDLDVQETGRKRREAKGNLTQLAKDRGRLQEALAQCGKAGPSLSKHTTERTALETELRRFAAVQRPNAEAALLEHVTERAELEKKLASLVKKLREANTTSRMGEVEASDTEQAITVHGSLGLSEASDTEQAITVHGSLGLSEASDTEQAEAALGLGASAARAAMLATESQIRMRLVQLARDADEAIRHLEQVDSRALVTATKITELDREADEVLTNVSHADAAECNEGGILLQLQALDERTSEILLSLEASEGDMSKATEAARSNAAEEATVQEKFVREILLQQADATAIFLDLNLREQSLRHTRILLEVEKLKGQLAQLEATSTEVELVEGRSKHVLESATQIEGHISEARSALEDCARKREALSAQIEDADRAKADAERSLKDILAERERFLVAADDSQGRRGITWAKLKEGLESKKLLRDKVEGCRRRRHEARAKLAACLQHKAALYKKISEAKGKMKKGLFQKAGGRREELEVWKVAADLLHESDGDFTEFVKLEKEASTSLAAATEELEESGRREMKLLGELSDEDGAALDVAAGLAKVYDRLFNVSAALPKVLMDVGFDHSDASQEAARDDVRHASWMEQTHVLWEAVEDFVTK